MAHEQIEMVLRVATALLTNVPEPTREDVHEAVRTAMKTVPNLEVTQLRLLEEAERVFDIFVPRQTLLEDATGHEPWLADWKADHEWRFWRRYRTLLEDREGLPPRVVRRLDEVTDEILSLLENPTRLGPWDRRGMVVGQVQSGKTSNYIGLLSKAADSGYRLLIILAGLHNSLRSQTQLRVDEGLLGYDTRQRMNFDTANLRMGVGQLPGFPFEQYIVQTLTNSSETGDFRLNIANNATRVGSDPFVLIIKKNASVLRNLIQWATALARTENTGGGRAVVRDLPLLVIDDEADFASVNTRVVPRDEDGRVSDEFSPTVINGLIRQLLHSFDRSAYVGYTATPFANIYIPRDAATNAQGDDLFPRSFIISLKPPTDYVGPARVFGITGATEAGIEEAPAMPIIRSAEDSGDWIPDGHKKDHVPGALPPSLREALRVFILSCAARRARGQVAVHNSMLVHVTRFTDVQRIVRDEISEELSFLKDQIRYQVGPERERVLREFKTLWEDDFIPTTAEIAGQPTEDWAAIEGELIAAAERIVVREVNGTAADALEYHENPDGLSVIAIGGDKLSRGLTLEGLTVSYYLRASRMYDTLMQMGRWFGYRPGYLDLCRLYTTDELVNAYRDIALADEELRQQFDVMAESRQTPEEFGLRVRNHSGLLITAASKMRSGRTVSVSFSEGISETVVFEMNDIGHNLQVAEALVRDLGSPKPENRVRNTPFWRDVDGSRIRLFFEEFKTHPTAHRANAQLLARYIQSRLADNELTRWTVALISVAGANVVHAEIGGIEVGLTKRARLAHPYSIRRVLSPPDELIGLEPGMIAQLREAERLVSGSSGQNAVVPSGARIRRTRSPQEGLLLLYPLSHPDSEDRLPPVMAFAVSFPFSPNARPIEYTINDVYFEQEFALVR